MNTAVRSDVKSKVKGPFACKYYCLKVMLFYFRIFLYYYYESQTQIFETGIISKLNIIIIDAAK